MGEEHPVVFVLAGPNGAGKSTAAPLLIHEMAGIERYINADAIARGLSPFDPKMSAVAAGRVMLLHMDELAAERQNFAIETTLAGVRLAKRLERLRDAGYQIHIVYLWLPSPELAVERVAQRVRLGGHSIDEPVIKRRYFRSLENFMEIYRPSVRSWRVYDNAGPSPRAIASGSGDAVQIDDREKWDTFVEQSKLGATDHE
jgi:predicted ABC-type ATPase